ncbi:MAG: hypothetical protein OXF54_04665, partial [Caldilineaceae bacterium]|nr:hypothetical protein [Caldilineaceae bacterium]
FQPPLALIPRQTVPTPNLACTRKLKHLPLPCTYGSTHAPLFPHLARLKWQIRPQDISFHPTIPP